MIWWRIVAAVLRRRRLRWLLRRMLSRNVKCLNGLSVWRPCSKLHLESALRRLPPRRSTTQLQRCATLLFRTGRCAATFFFYFNFFFCSVFVVFHLDLCPVPLPWSLSVFRSLTHFVVLAKIGQLNGAATTGWLIFSNWRCDSSFISTSRIL